MSRTSAQLKAAPALTAAADDPLIVAVFAKLPPIGADWPSAEREAWLRLAAFSFEVLYGAPDAPVTLPVFLPRRAEVATAAAAAPSASVEQATPAPKGPSEHAGYDFYIGNDNRAYRDNGTPAAAIDVSDEQIYDYRRAEARNRETIIWADGQTGAVPGMSFCGPG